MKTSPHTPDAKTSPTRATAVSRILNNAASAAPAARALRASENSIDRLIPVREAFAIIGWGVTKGYAEIAAGRLAVVKNGRSTFVRLSETQRYIDAISAASAGRAA